MKFKKIISAIAAAMMLSSSLAIVASADATITWDPDAEAYRISDAKDVATRTPYIESTVTKMTSEEIVALGKAKTSSLSALKLKDTAGKYGDTSTYTMYKVDGVIKNVGNLVMGYDNDDNSIAIKIMGLDASIDCSSLGDNLVDIGYAKTTDPTTNNAWTGGLNKSTNIMLVSNQLGTDKAIPSEDTAEGKMINADYPFVVYFVVNVGTKATVSYSEANAAVSYYVGAEQIPVKMAANSKAFELTEGSSTVAVTGVSIKDKADFTLDLNGETTRTLTATVAPTDATNTEVTWSSDNEKAATVVDGKVTAVGEGEAKITVTTVDGGFTDSVKVTVKDTTPPENPIVDVTPSKITGDYGTKTLKYIAKIVKNADATAFIKVTKTLNGKTESKETTQTIAELLGGVATEGTLVSADVAIGVLTADTDAVFSFGLVK